MGNHSKKRKMIDKKSDLSIENQCNLLEISRASFYYKPKGEKPDNLQMMQLMDTYAMEDPTAGVLSMQSMLEEKGYKSGYERVRRLMRKANIHAIYPRKNLTQLGQKKYIHPYLLRNLKIDKPNQVWGIDITYIPMQSGFMYLTAIIDHYSRMIVGWGLSNSLDAKASLNVLQQAIMKYGSPGIVNSDQGSQFTCAEYIDYLKSQHIKISMDGKGRALDNVYIERFFRTLKYQHIYLNPSEDGISLYKGINHWIKRYNNKWHQGIGRKKPIELYYEKVA